VIYKRSQVEVAARRGQRALCWADPRNDLPQLIVRSVKEIYRR
jgi:hypothetical protein